MNHVALHHMKWIACLSRGYARLNLFERIFNHLYIIYSYILLVLLVGKFSDFLYHLEISEIFPRFNYERYDIFSFISLFTIGNMSILKKDKNFSKKSEMQV